MNDRSIRSLAYLADSASTARLLNLLRVAVRYRDDAAWAAKPFFKNPILNKSLLLKHRLRRDETELFFDERRTATKIIVPIDGKDLKVGGRSLFVGQMNYDAILADFLGDGWRSDTGDRELLGVIDTLPSLDPFLLREQLRRHEREPARCYFDISEADMAKMFAFVERELQKLIELCYGGQGGGDGRHSARLVRKILSTTVDAEIEPLRVTLRLEKKDFQEGVFCWKGFLYYKWTLRQVMPDVGKTADAIVNLRPRGKIDAETKARLDKSRAAMQAAILDALDHADKSLRYYDTAFASLLDGRPQAFRDFLLDAPAMFCDLGERLGAVTHIVTFWKFRFPEPRMTVVTAPELADIVADFEESLAFTKRVASPYMLAS